jgi:hypothetical protein
MEFDDEWINKFDNSSNKRPWTLKVFYFLVDRENTLQKINQEVIEIEGNTLTRDNIVKLIIKNKKNHQQLVSILTYIVRDVDSKTNYSSFFSEGKIDSISFKDSDRIFESTNSLFFIFREGRKKNKENTTKKVRITSTKYTRRKQLKDIAQE